MQQRILEFLEGKTYETIAANYPRGIQEQYKQLFKEVFSRDPICSGCSKGRKDWSLFIDYSITGINTQPIMTQSNYKLKAGCIPYFQPIHSYISNDNLTDETAVMFIAASPSHLQFFETLPEGYEQKVEDYKNKFVKETAPVQTEEPTVDAVSNVSESGEVTPVVDTPKNTGGKKSNRN